MDSLFICDAAESDLKQNGHHWSSDVSPGTVQDKEAAELDFKGAFCNNSAASEELHVKECIPAAPEQQEVTSCETSFVFSAKICSDDHLPASVNPSEDCSLDVLRIVKHKPSAIVFCDYGCSSDSQVIDVSESSDEGEASASSSTSTGEESDDDDDDEFPETLQYREFLVSRHRRSLSRNRKCLRRKPDVLFHGAAFDGRKSSSKSKPELTGSKDAEDGQQVITTLQGQNNNNNNKRSSSVNSRVVLQVS